MHWNRTKAATHLRRHAHSHAEVVAGTYRPHRCAAFVADAIAAGGVTLRRENSAKDHGASLLAAGFEVVPDPDPICVGDVVVIDAIAGHPHGHMAMFDGENWISDFVQRDPWGGSAYREARPACVRYRRWPTLSPAQRAMFDRAGPRRIVLPATTSLFKFTEWNILGGMDPTPWWALQAAMPGLGAAGLAAILHAASRDPAGLAAHVRARFAVMLDWNSMRHATSGMLRIQHARTTCAVAGFHGRCAPVQQARAHSLDPRPDRTLHGGAHQVCLPGLSTRELRVGAISFAG